MKQSWVLVFFIFCLTALSAQQIELNMGWRCANVKEITVAAETISQTSYNKNNWIPATVPGTVLTTLLNNKLIPDPFYGMNNKYIPDIFNTGNEYYTYWFVNDFKDTALNNEQVWLQLRGINYKCDVFLNGKKLNLQTFEGMHLRQQYNITTQLSS